jgi:hypothetical protein
MSATLLHLAIDGSGFPAADNKPEDPEVKLASRFGLSTVREALWPLAALTVFRSYYRTLHSGSTRYRNQQALPRQNHIASCAWSQNIRDNSA